MDFLKKHWEKALLAAALLAVIVVAVVLMAKIDTLQQDVRSPARRGPRDDAAPTFDPAPYANAADALQRGFRWETMTHELFIPDIEPPPTNTVPEPTGPDDEIIALLAVHRVPFKLLLKAYTWDAAAETAGNFQINFQFRERTFFVDKVGDNIGDRYENTGYQLVSFTRKFTKVFDQRLGAELDRDVSELVIQHPNDDPITLVMLQVTQEREPVATVRCAPMEDVEPRRYQIRRGQRFECAGETHIVVDITPEQMIIRNIKTEEKQTIGLRTLRPTPQF